jgi:hypothetical protein
MSLGKKQQKIAQLVSGQNQYINVRYFCNFQRTAQSTRGEISPNLVTLSKSHISRHL